MKMDLFVSFWPLLIVTVFWAYSLPIGWFASFGLALIIALQGAQIWCLRKTMELRERIYQMELSE